MTYALVLDSGSKLIKCAIADISTNNKILALESFEPEIIHSEDGFGRTFNHKTIWTEISTLAKRTIAVAQINPREIRYITSCSIRPSCCFTNDTYDPLYIGASFDARGFDKAEEIEQHFTELTQQTLYHITGHSPLLLFGPARFASVLDQFNQESNPPQIAHYLPIDSWILTKMGGEFHTNFTSAAESGFFDLHTKTWHDAWSTLLGIPENFLPPIVFSGEIIGNVSPEIQNFLGLSGETELVAGLPDTQAALLGVGCIHPGHIAAVLGTTTPVQGVSSVLHIDNQQRTWSSVIACKNLCDLYIYEANTGITGQIVKWGANFMDPQLELSMSDRYQLVSKLYQQYDQEEHQMSVSQIEEQMGFAFLGPASFASSKTSLTPGVFRFLSPGGPDEYILKQHTFIGTIYDNIQFAVTKNIEHVAEILQNENLKYYLLGGMTRNQTLCQRFTDLLQTPVTISQDPESTIQGLLILCNLAQNIIRNPADLQTYFEKKASLHSIQPRSDMSEKLLAKYTQWQALRKKYEE